MLELPLFPCLGYKGRGVWPLLCHTCLLQSSLFLFWCKQPSIASHSDLAVVGKKLHLNIHFSPWCLASPLSWLALAEGHDVNVCQDPLLLARCKGVGWSWSWNLPADATLGLHVSISCEALGLWWPIVLLQSKSGLDLPSVVVPLHFLAWLSSSTICRWLYVWIQWAWGVPFHSVPVQS